MGIKKLRSRDAIQPDSLIRDYKRFMNCNVDINTSDAYGATKKMASKLECINSREKRRYDVGRGNGRSISMSTERNQLGEPLY